MKITIIGNSVALRVRPPENPPTNLNYTYLLRKAMGTQVMIENMALGASTVVSWVKHGDALIHTFPDVYIIQLGVVEATNREVPLWFYRLATKRIDTLFTKILKSIYRGAITKRRRLLSKIRGGRSWVSVNTFEKHFDSLIYTLVKETNAQVIALPINITNDRVENQLPGSKENQRRYNEIIKKITEKHHQQFLDLSDLTSEEHYPDGVHFNTSGHRIVANRLISLLEKG